MDFIQTVILIEGRLADKEAIWAHSSMYRGKKKVCKSCKAAAKQGQAEKLGRPINKLLATTYKD